VERTITFDKNYLHGLVGKISTTHDKNKLLQLLDYVFNEEWLKVNSPIDIMDHSIKLHPLPYMIKHAMENYINCTLDSLAKFSDLFWGETKIPSGSVFGLRDSDRFRNTLFELDIFSLLKLSGALITFEHETTGGQDVEAKISMNGKDVLVECKSLHEGELYKEIKNWIASVNNPLVTDVELHISWETFPDNCDLEEIEGKLKEVTSSRKSFSLKKGHPGHPQ